MSARITLLSLLLQGFLFLNGTIFNAALIFFPSPPAFFFAHIFNIGVREQGPGPAENCSNA